MTREEQNQAAGLPAGFEHKGPGAPAYRPIRVSLLLQVEGREPIIVAGFEPQAVSATPGGPVAFYRVPALVTHGNPAAMDAALTVEVRELIAAQRKHEDPTETEDR